MSEFAEVMSAALQALRNGEPVALATMVRARLNVAVQAPAEARAERARRTVA